MAYRNGAPVRLQDVAQVVAGPESPFQASWVGKERGEMIGIWRQPGANTVQLVEQIKAALPQLQTGIPPSVKVSIVSDLSIAIRESFTDVKLTLVAAIVLVVIVIFIFLRNFWATLIPSVTVPLSLVGTFGIMYMLGYSLDNLSLMALTLAVGLVVDDAIVMLENIFRYLEQGCDRVTAALKGAKEIGFTIVSITVSLVAVFIPILFMSGIVGRLFREFGVVVAVAVVLSALIALTLSPMMASLILENPREAQTRSPLPMERAQLQASHRRLRTRARAHATAPARHDDAEPPAHRRVRTGCSTPCRRASFPRRTPASSSASPRPTRTSRSTAWRAAWPRSRKSSRRIPPSPTFGSSIGGTGSSGMNTGRVFIQLKPYSQRAATADQIIQRLRPKFAAVPGITTFLQSIQNIRVGARLARTQYQYTLQDIDI